MNYVLQTQLQLHPLLHQHNIIFTNASIYSLLIN